MSSSSGGNQKTSRCIDLIFSKFAAFYGHLWRSQFKDEAFLTFAKKEWQEALGEFSEAVIKKAVLNCRDFYQLPPNLPQMVQCCRQIKKQTMFYAVEETKKPTNKAIVEACLQECKQILNR